MVIASNGYWYCTCKLMFQKKYPPELVGRCCPVCTIQINFSQEELEEIKYSRVKLLIFTINFLSTSKSQKKRTHG